MQRLALAFLLLFALGTVHAAPAGKPVRVACVGDSITFGSGIADRDHASYPAQLQDLLGPGYEVKNFGVSAHTMLSKGDHPWANSPACAQALAFKPDIVVIKLGSNDSKSHNWDTHRDEFSPDATALVNHFTALPSRPRVMLCSPAPAFKNAKGEEVFGIRDAVITGEQIPALIGVAKATGSEFVDLHQDLLLNGAATVESWMPDKIHPNPFGAEAIARRVAEQVRAKTDPAYDVATRLKSTGIAFTEKDFHGYRQYDFPLPGRPDVPCSIVAPRTAAAGHPWIWRARFFGHEPALDTALLDRGYHVGYCDIIEHFGGPEASKRWDAFYVLARKLDLAPKMILEGMSRGGLNIFNWGKANPDKVSAIYGDNPVCDIRSWPGKKDAGLYAQALKAYGISEEQAADFKGNPIDGLEPLAKKKVPVFLVLGAEDEVVPPAENANVLADRYRRLGGPVQTWVKPGMKHHPHGLSPVFPLLRALLRADGRGINPAAEPACSVEYRSGAGWGKRNWLQEVTHVKETLAANKDTRLVFLGDSISQGLSGSDDRVAKEGGNRPIDRYAKLKAVSCGISGNRTEHVLAMLRDGLLDDVKPRTIVLMIGVNNANAGGHTGIEIAGGTFRIVQELRKRQPQAKIIVLGSFPSQDSGSLARQALDEDQRLLAVAVANAKDSSIVRIDPGPAFLNPDGTLNGGVSGDKIHLTPAGYDAWAALLDGKL